MIRKQNARVKVVMGRDSKGFERAKWLAPINSRVLNG
jgi:hypothetical protein